MAVSGAFQAQSDQAAHCLCAVRLVGLRSPPRVNLDEIGILPAAADKGAGAGGGGPTALPALRSTRFIAISNS
jgi:hypothetical protein